MDSKKNRSFVNKSFRAFFIPSLLSTLGLALGGLADCLFIGNVHGAVGLTAISIGQPIYMLFNTLSYSLSIGGSIFYAEALSEGRPDEGRQIFTRVMRCAVSIYLVVCTLGLCFLPVLLRFLGAGEPGTEVYAACEEYVRAQLLLCPVMFCQGPLYYFVNADGNPKQSALALVLSNFVDIALNYVFVVRLGMGVAGSVYSTGIGAAVMLIISFEHILKKKGELRFTRAPFEPKSVLRAAKLGFSTAIQYIYQFVTVLCFNHLLMSISGLNGVAAFDVVFNVALLACAVCDAVSMAIQPMISTYRGEHNQLCVHQTLMRALTVTMIASVLLNLPLALVPESVCELFGLNGAAALELCSRAVRIYSASVLLACFNMVVTYYYQSMQLARRSFVLFTLRCFVLVLAFGLFFASKGIDWFWWLYPASEAGCFVLALASLLKNGELKAPPRPDHKVYSALIEANASELSGVCESITPFLENCGASAAASYYVPLCVEEMCSVIITNGFGGEKGYIQLTIVPDANGVVTLHIRDSAVTFNPFTTDTTGIDLTNGLELDALGMRLVKEKAKEFFYRRYAGFNTLVVRI